MKVELVEKVAALLLGRVNAPEQEIYRVARDIIAAIPQAGDAGELGERLERASTFCGPLSDVNHLFAEAATTIRTLQARLDVVREEEREACAKVAENWRSVDVEADDYLASSIEQEWADELATAIRERSGHD